MNIFGWIIFALINVVILFSLDYDPGKTGKLQSFILGTTGALSSSLFMYLVVKGNSQEFMYTFSIILILESILLFALFVSKSVTYFRI